MGRHLLLAALTCWASACSCDGGTVVGDPADAGVAALDASLAHADASAEGVDAAANPLADAATTAGPDATTAAGPDAARPGPDAGPSVGWDAAVAGLDDAVVVSADFPAGLGCGGTFSATVQVENTGTSTWTFPDFKLGAVDDADPFYGPDTRVWLPSGASVAPGETWTFTVPLTAPSTPGSYVTDWRMVHEGVRWFGGTSSATVRVACVDPSTLTGKLMMGYQGWFFCPGDGSPYNSWVHWFGGSGQPTVDLWPDTRELDADELCATGYTLPSGAPAYLYSAWNAKTVARHFRWMADHGLDGVMAQRFTLGLHDPTNKAALDKVAQNVRAGAEAHGRVFNVMYDLSGHDPSTVVADLEADWTYLVKTMGLTSSPRYLRHRGRPLVSVWGFGFADRPGTPADLAALIDFFHDNADPELRATVMGGVPREWRNDATWAGPLRAFDVISPWSVGSYRTDADIDAYQPRLVADLADCASRGIDFMPVVWPGFSWFNLKGDPGNAFPRRGGAMYWRQVYNAVSAGVPAIYGAMFDEVDEGTAMFKVAQTAADQPTQAPFVPLDVDGYALPSDWYLQLADQAGRMLRKETPLSGALPLTP